MTIEIAYDGALTGSANMQCDMLLVDRVRDGTADIALRTYRWNPWCVSLGTNQQSTHIDTAACSRRGIDIVTRPTGGRAVLHANELTYAFAVRLPRNRSALDVYRAFHLVLHQALVRLAPDLALGTLAQSLREHYAASGPLGQVCFSAHAPSELLWNGRKVVGSAQRVLDGVVLQHGSILCGPGHEELGTLLSVDEHTRDRIVAATSNASATLSDVTGRDVQPNVVEDLLRSYLTPETLSDLVLTDL